VGTLIGALSVYVGEPTIIAFVQDRLYLAVDGQKSLAYEQEVLFGTDGGGLQALESSLWAVLNGVQTQIMMDRQLQWPTVNGRDLYEPRVVCVNTSFAFAGYASGREWAWGYCLSLQPT